ncbi:50S ribosomal protein L4 [Candidatus Azambacteria bacterium]|nr:50S ribosomal protein L4 [Candidatus Azambacteria bacterium]
MKAKLYNQSGEVIGEFEIPEKLFGVSMNRDLLHQVVTVLEANRRKPIAHTKTREEVRGGGKKPWRQKGTGRARHGSIRSPLWRGGGVTFGPRQEKKYGGKIPKKMRRKALAAALSEKFRAGEIRFLDALKLPQPKTKEMARVLTSLLPERAGKKRPVSTLVVTPGKGGEVLRAAANLPRVEIRRAQDLNVLDLLRHKFAVVEKDAIERIPA